MNFAHATEYKSRAQYEKSDDTKNVLVLNSSHRGYGWTDSIMAGVEAVMRAAPEDIELWVEYLDAKLVTPKPRDRIALAHLILQFLSQAPQQFVSGDMAACIVYNLELVKVQIAQRMVSGYFFESRQQRLQTLLESPAIEEIGQGIVASLVTEFLREAVGVTDVPTSAPITV